MTIPYEDLRRLNQPFFNDYQSSFLEFLDSGWYVLGSFVQQFESEFAKYCGVKHCIGVANGLDALIIALRILELPSDTEVIVPSNTYVATILAIIHAGLKPVLVEPNPETYTLCPQAVQRAITKQTRVIMPVHLYGKMADMPMINAIAKAHNCITVTDCAQAHGASLNHKKAGSYADIGCFSFYPTKNLGALGDGGAIVTNNDEYSAKIRTFRNYGSDKKYFNKYVGYNSRLDEVQAAFLSIKLKALDAINAHKQRLANIYFSELKGRFQKPLRQSQYTDVFHIFNILHPERDLLRAYLEKQGIKTEIHYPVPPHRQEALRDMFRDQTFPIAEFIHAQTISLPISYCHTESDILQVASVLNNY
jgi:dTDP-4-amino-4,6-dideoxygalactose transaminase